MISKHLIIAFFAFFYCFVASAQHLNEDAKKNDKVVVETKDGSIIYGFFVEKNSSFIIVRSSSLDIVSIPLDEITGIKSFNVNVSNELDNKGRIIDYHNSTKYLLFPSGYGLKKGQSYYENIWVFWNSYAYGVTDNITLSVSTELASILFGLNFPLAFLNAKYSIPFKNDSGAFGVNLSYLTVPQSNFTSFSFLTGSLTLGGRNSNFTIGTGAGFRIENGFFDEVIPVTLSYMGRVSDKISFITENWFILEDDLTRFNSVVSGGVRVHFKNPGSALNLTIVRPLEGIIDFIGFPFVSATIGLK